MAVWNTSFIVRWLPGGCYVRRRANGHGYVKRPLQNSKTTSINFHPSHSLPAASFAASILPRVMHLSVFVASTILIKHEKVCKCSSAESNHSPVFDIYRNQNTGHYATQYSYAYHMIIYKRYVDKNEGFQRSNYFIHAWVVILWYLKACFWTPTKTTWPQVLNSTAAWTLTSNGSLLPGLGALGVSVKPLM